MTPALVASFSRYRRAASDADAMLRGLISFDSIVLADALARAGEALEATAAELKTAGGTRCQVETFNAMAHLVLANLYAYARPALPRAGALSGRALTGGCP